MRQVKSIDNLIVVHELELAIKCNLDDLLWSLGNQYNVGSLQKLSNHMA